MDTAALPVTGDEALHPQKEQLPPRRRRNSAIAALDAISSHLTAGGDVPTFVGRLGATLAEQVGARRAAFWRLGPSGSLTLQPFAFGFGTDSAINNVRIQLGADGDNVIERAIFRDQLELTGGTAPQLDALWHREGLSDVKSSIAVPWRAGDDRLGAVAAYDSPRGFGEDDLWLLRLAGMATGLLWRYRELDAERGRTASRLDEATSARRHLLNNIAAGGDEARRRFASALRDDSLQLLTGAELQLERIRNDRNGRMPAQLDQLADTLKQVEGSLRRLLTHVSPLLRPGVAQLDPPGYS